MILYYLNSSLKSLRSNIKFTLLNVMGFAFALAVCVAITLYVVQEFSYDHHFKDANQIARLIDANNNSSDVDYRVKDLLLDNFPEIENACFFSRQQSEFNIKANKEALKSSEIVSVSSSFFDLFSIPFISGNPNQPFQDKRSAILTEETANHLFGTNDVVGKEIIILGKDTVNICGVIPNFPKESSIEGGIFVNGENRKFQFSFSCENWNDKSTHRYEFRLYAKIKPLNNFESVKQNINRNSKVLAPYISEVDFLPLRDIYLNDHTTGAQTKKGNADLLILLTLIAGIIMLLAIVNYINLTLAQQSKKNKITGIRKSYGASFMNLFWHFISESVIISSLAFFISLFIILSLEPIFQKILDVNFELSQIFQNYLLLYFYFGIVLLGILSGLAPAIILSRSQANNAIKGSKKRNKSYSRNALIIFQFTSSIALIICILVIQKQIHFAKHKDTGFSKEQLLCIRLPYLPIHQKRNVDYLAEELRKSTLIKNISLTNGVPGEVFISMGSMSKDSTKQIHIPCIYADTNFLSTFNIDLIQGAKPLASEYDKTCLINESYYKFFEFKDLEKQRFENGGGFDITGVVKDFQFNSVHSKIEPLCILYSKNSNTYHMNIRIAAKQIGNAMDLIQEKWSEFFSDYPITYRFFDDWFDSMYKKEEKLAQTISLFAVLAILISCFGILGLAIFSAEQRTKEIGVRKTNGAKTHEIIKMLNRDFLKWVALSFLIASPIAWYIMNQWLQNFAYKTELSWWIFVLAGIIAFGIALLTVSWQSWRAAKRNPVESIRYE